MHELGAAEAWRTNTPRRRRRGVGFLVAWFKFRLVVVVVSLVIGGAVSLKDKFFPNSAVERPTEWPVDVAPIASFVEAERGLSFDHPVDIDFLSEADYIEYLGAGSYEPTAEELEEFENLSKVYNAAGLAADVDLLKAWTTVTSVGSLGVYLPDEDRIVVRGVELTPGVRVVVAHELVHALQAQHFDLTLGGPGDLSIRSIVEADALRVEEVYLDTLSPADRERALDELYGNEEPPAALSSIPEAISETFSAPYVLGPLVVEEAFARNGNEGVNELLRNPPTEEILINPHLVDTPQVDAEPSVTSPPDATVLEDVEPLSMLDTLAMLDAWLPWSQARGALDGWSGGGYVSYVRSDGAVCFTVSASFDDTTKPFETAVGAWARASGSNAAPTTVGRRVDFEACDRGSDALEPPPAVVSMTTALYIENLFVEQAPEDKIAFQQCLARKMIDDPAVAPLVLKENLTAEEQDVVEWVRNVATDACETEVP